MVRVQSRRFTAAEYYQMSEQGILAPTERTELINGEILTMVAKGTAHAATTTVALTVFAQRLPQPLIIRSQDPVQLGDDSEPEPDIVIAQPDAFVYSMHHPTPADVFLVVEVADSSLSFDLGTKALLYAEAEIADYWVLDVVHRQLHVFRQPVQGRYQSHSILAETLEIAPLAFAQCEILISDLFPPLPPGASSA